jgi:hypothetical protein
MTRAPDAERSRDSRNRRKAGLVKVAAWVPAAIKADVERMIQAMCEEKANE